MVNKYMEICSTSLKFREMQIKITMRLYFFLSVIHQKKKKKEEEITNAIEGTEKGNPYTLLLGMKIATVIIKNNVRFLKKFKIQLPYDLSISLLCLYPKETKSVSQRGICIPLWMQHYFQEPIYGNSLSVCQQINGWRLYIYIVKYSARREKEIYHV